MRPIDADKLKEDVNGLSTHWLNEWDTLGVLAVVNKQPTVDAVEVVRCKDCKHRYDSEHCPMCQEHDYRDEDGDCDYYTVDRTTDNGFCHLAERKEENADD